MTIYDAGPLAAGPLCGLLNMAKLQKGGRFSSKLKLEKLSLVGFSLQGASSLTVSLQPCEKMLDAQEIEGREWGAESVVVGSAFLGRPHLHSGGPKTLLLKGLEISGAEVGGAANTDPTMTDATPPLCPLKEGTLSEVFFGTSRGSFLEFHARLSLTIPTEMIANESQGIYRRGIGSE